MWWTNTLRTSAEDLGTLAENEPPTLFLTLFLSVCFSYPFFFYLNLELNLFLHVAVIGAIYHWHSAN